MSVTIIKVPKSLLNIPSPPQKLFCCGNQNLLNAPIIIAIIGARKACLYSKNFAHTLAGKIAQAGGVVVSGGALGIDKEAHEGAGNNTIAVMPCSLDKKVPATNAKLLTNIYDNALAISEYELGTKPQNWHFVQRNRIVTGLSQAVVIAEADENSGSMRSAQWAIKQNKPIFVLPHRLGESCGTNNLIKTNKAKPIYDIDNFLCELGLSAEVQETDEIMKFCALNPSYDEAVAKFGNAIFEYELAGKIAIKNGKVASV